MKSNNPAKLKRYLPTALSVLSCAGVILTAVTSSKAATKAEKMQTIPEKAKCYIPTVVIAGGTIVCIVASNKLNKKQYAQLLGAYTLLNHKFGKYQQKVKELCGEEVHNQIMDEIEKEECNPPDIWAAQIASYTTLVPQKLGDPEVTRTFYDEYSKRYFESTLSQVMSAESDLNRTYILGGAVGVNDFYERLGLAHLPDEECNGWDSADGVYWIDFGHRVMMLDDGMEVIAIEMPFGPTPMEDL